MTSSSHSSLHQPLLSRMWASGRRTCRAALFARSGRSGSANASARRPFTGYAGSSRSRTSFIDFLIRSHVHAIWLASTPVTLGKSMKEALDLEEPADQVNGRPAEASADADLAQRA